MIHGALDVDGKRAVARRGDATEQAIEPGDFLTTSDTPGHAMKAVDHDRAVGATLDKAMTALPQGKIGMVLVLVNLQ